ncbi:uncharacterized protein [Misgurnus anguillicaudatus]|uniref:uncharacterized protein isoform X2 n=1 Tax=Misgurnus anguillicaudatus TaxID=75329 RepID=UPI003CCF3021
MKSCRGPNRPAAVSQPFFGGLIARVLFGLFNFFLSIFLRFFRFARPETSDNGEELSEPEGAFGPCSERPPMLAVGSEVNPVHRVECPVSTPDTALETCPDAQPRRPLMRFSERMSVTVNGCHTKRPSFRSTARSLRVTPQMRPTCGSQPSRTHFGEFTPRPLHARSDCSLVESRNVSTNCQARGMRFVYPKLVLRRLDPGRIRSADIAQRPVRERYEEVGVTVRRVTPRSNASPVRPLIHPGPVWVTQRRRGYHVAPTVQARIPPRVPVRSRAALMEDTSSDGSSRLLLAEEISSAQPERPQALEPGRSLSVVVSQQKPVMVVRPLGRCTRWGRVAPAQQVQPSPAWQFRASPTAAVSLPSFTSSGKDKPVQVVRPLGWPTLEGHVAPPRQDRSPPARQDRSPPARQDRSPPARQDRSPPARQDRSPPARQDRSPPARQDRSPPARQDRSPPARQDRSPPARQDRTPPARQDRSPPARQERSPPARQDQTLPPPADVSQKPVMVVHPLGRSTLEGCVAPAQQVQTLHPQRFLPPRSAVVSLPSFTSRGKDKPVQVVRPLGWPPREERVVPARQDRTPPPRQDRTPPAAVPQLVQIPPARQDQPLPPPAAVSQLVQIPPAQQDQDRTPPARQDQPAAVSQQKPPRQVQGPPARQVQAQTLGRTRPLPYGRSRPRPPGRSSSIPLVSQLVQIPPPRQDQIPPPRQDQAPPPRQDQAPSPRQDQAPSPRQDQAPSLRQDQAPSPRQDQAPSPRQVQAPPARQVQAPPFGKTRPRPFGRTSFRPYGRSRPRPPGRSSSFPLVSQLVQDQILPPRQVQAPPPRQEQTPPPRQVQARPLGRTRPRLLGRSRPRPYGRSRP